jgi:hypothetical protein
MTKPIGFYKKKGKTRPITPRKQGTIFFPPKYKEASRKIRIDTVEGAKESIKWLNDEWDDAKTATKRRKLISFANLARNRATVMSGNPNISYGERMEAGEVAMRYKTWLDNHHIGD